MPKGQFQLVKHDEKLADAILENLMPNSSTNQLSKAFSSTNRLINKGIASFIKDWEVVFKFFNFLFKNLFKTEYLLN